MWARLHVTLAVSGTLNTNSLIRIEFQQLHTCNYGMCGQGQIQDFREGGSYIYKVGVSFYLIFL